MYVITLPLIIVLLYGVVTQCLQLEMGVPHAYFFLSRSLYPPIQSCVPSRIGFSLISFIYGQLYNFRVGR